MSQTLPIDPSTRYTPIIATAGQTRFDGNWPLQSAADVEVYRTRAGVRTKIVPASIEGLGQAEGFSAIFNAGARAGDRYELVGLATLERRSSVTRGGRYDTAALDADLDRQTLLQQEVRRDLGRTLSAPLGETLGPLPAAPLRAVKSFVFDADSEPAVDITPSEAVRQARAYSDYKLVAIENSAMTAAEDGDAFLVVRVTTSGLRIASTDDPSQAGSVAGVSVEPLLTDQVTQYRVRGELINEAWDFLPGAAVYVGLNGELSQELPVFGFVQRLGFAVSPQTVALDLQPPTVVSGIPDVEEPFAFAPAVKNVTLANAPRSVRALGVVGDGSDETAKFDGVTGPVEFEGLTARVSSIPTDVLARGGFWEIPEAEGPGTMAGRFPTDPFVLPCVISRLIPPHSYAAFLEDGGHTIDNACYAYAGAHYGGHSDTEPGLVYLSKEDVEVGRVTVEVLWRPDAENPEGYMAPAGFAIDHSQFALVSRRDVERRWKLYRRNVGHYKEGFDAISTVAGSAFARFRKSALQWGAFAGMRFRFGVAPADVSNLTFSTSQFYVVTLVTNDEVRFAPLVGAFPLADESVNNEGGYFFAYVEATDFAEVLFEGGLSWGEAFLAATGATSQPKYVLGNGVDSRFSGNRGRACIGSGTLVLMDNLLGAGDVSDYAIIRQARATANIPVGNTGGPSVTFYDDGTPNGVWIGVLRARDVPLAAPVIWYSRDGLASEPTYVVLPAASANCACNCIVTQDYGKGARLQLVATERRDPGGGYRRLNLFLWDVDVDEFLAAPPETAGALFRRYAFGKTDYFKHNGAPNGDGPGALGTSTLTKMPGEGGLYFAVGNQPPPAGNRSYNLAAAVAYKIDTRRLTGCPNPPGMTPGDLAYPMNSLGYFTSILLYEGAGEGDPPTYGGIALANAHKIIRYRKPRYDLTLGDYNTEFGCIEFRTNGNFRLRYCALALADDDDFKIEVWDFDADALFAPPYGRVPSTAAYDRRAGGLIYPVHGVVEVEARNGQRLGLIATSGTPVSSPGAGPVKDAAYLFIDRVW